MQSGVGMAAPWELSRAAVVLLTGTLVFWVVGQYVSIEVLPDYLPYERIYEIEGANFAESPTERFFTVAIQWSNRLGLSYVQFRSLVLTFSLGLFLWSTLLLDRWVARQRHGRDLRNVSLGTALGVMAAVLIFFLEFFLVRIRAGLALSLVSFAFALYVTAGRVSAARLLAVVVVLFISSGMHGFTTAVLSYFLFAPLIYRTLYTRITLTNARRVDVTLVTIMLIGSSIGIVLLAARWSEMRGEHISSPLNAFRLICIAAVPLAISLSTTILRAALALGAEASKAGRPAIRSRESSWATFGTLCYLALALALLIADALGATQDSGEAMVRIFTLSSVPAILVFVMQVRKDLLLWLFLLSANSMFFVNTLLTPWRS